MERLTHKRENGIKRGYWSPNKKQELVDRLAMYEDREESADFGKWIPCSERLPKDRQIVVADIECSIEDRMCIFASRTWRILPQWTRKRKAEESVRICERLG